MTLQRINLFMIKILFFSVSYNVGITFSLLYNAILSSYVALSCLGRYWPFIREYLVKSILTIGVYMKLED